MRLHISFYLFTFIFSASNTLAFTPYETNSEIMTEQTNQAALIVSDTDVSNEDTEYLDFYAGTIQYKNHQYILKRCTLGSYEYILSFKNLKDKDQIDQLLKSNSKFWLNTFSHYNSINDEHHLTVNEIEAIHSNESCHFEDLFDSFEENPELFNQLKELITPNKKRE